MKLSRIFVAVLGAALFLSSGVFAGEPNKATLNFVDKLSVEGKVVNPGKYTVQWDGTGPSVQVTLSQGKQTVATFPARVSEQPRQNAGNSYGSSTNADGSKSLTAIYIGNKHTVLELNQTSASEQQPAPQSSK